MKDFGEMVMNVIDNSDMVVGPPVSDDKDNPLSNNNVARRNRVGYADWFKDIWRKILNEHRRYTQVNDLEHIILTKYPKFSPLPLYHGTCFSHLIGVEKGCLGLGKVERYD
jgi:hypothetical protein